MSDRAPVKKRSSKNGPTPENRAERNANPNRQTPAAPDEPITRPGDLWILGEHRLLCGDSGKNEDVDRLLGGAIVHLVNTDPPYNVNVQPRSNTPIRANIPPQWRQANFTFRRR
jgi:hypothetical protein